MIKENTELKEIEYYLRLKLQNIVVGRDNEIEAIKMQFDTVMEGHSALTIIAGDIGIGKTALVKTALVKTALADLSKMNGTCVYGKFEQYKDEEPYIAMIQIIENIANHMLTFPEEKLERIRKEIIKYLGKDSALIIDIVPQMERIIGAQRKIEVADYQKLKIRLEKSFQKLITIAAKELYPLIIFIDDLQWADKPSWDIIKSINDTFSELELYIILAYRNNRDDYRSKMQLIKNELTRNVHPVEIELEDISHKDIKAMLLDIFNGNIEDVDYLTQIIYKRTLGNPLYIKQMLHMLLDNGFIYYHSQDNKWCSKPESFDIFNLPTGLEDIINRKIQNLSHELKELIEMAACIGRRFDIGLIARITEYKDDYIEERLEALNCTRLITETWERSEKKEIREFEFSHDRINQIVYEQMKPDKREQLHFDIAMQLLNCSDKIYIEENLLSITAHFLYCKRIILQEAEKDRLTVELYFAGLKAKQSAAIEHALKLFSLCEELLDNACWKKDYDSTLKIKLELAECEFVCGLYKASEAHFEEMLVHAACPEDLAEIKKRYMVMNFYIGKHDRVIELGLQALKSLGFNINLQRIEIQIAREIMYSRILYRNSRLESIRNAPVIKSKRIIAILEILNNMAPSANMINENLFTLVVLKSSNLSAKYGNSIYSPVGYAAYSLVLASVFGDFKKAGIIEEMSLNLAEIIDDNALKCAAYFLIGTFIKHWTAPSRESFDILQNSFDLGIQSGEFFFGGLAITSMIEMKYSMGEPLHEVKNFLTLHDKYGTKMNQDMLLRLTSIFADHIGILTSKDFSSADSMIDDEEISILNTNEVMTYYLLKLQRLYLEGKIDQAYVLSEKTIRQLDSVAGYFVQVDFVFYFLLLSLEKKRKQKDSTDRQKEKTFRKYKKKLLVWANMSPENHKGKYLLIEALHKSLNDENYDVARLFDEAIEHAKENDNLLLEALGNYLAAGYYSSNRKIAKVYAQDACRLFGQWGSQKIADRISRLYEMHDYFAVSEAAAADMAGEIAENTRQEREIPFKERLKDYQKELEALEMEASYIYFLDTICKEANADFAAILLENEAQLKLEYLCQDGRAASGFPIGIDPEQLEYMPKKVIRYASRTYQEIMIDAKPTEGFLARDDYIRNRASISIICLPLKYHDIFAGLIYLESQNDHQFNSMLLEHIKRLSFYLVAKQALAKEIENKSKVLINNAVKDHLTGRETEVLRCMAAGMSNKEIGENLHISLSTVKTHTLNLYGKLEVSSRVQAVIKAKNLKLV